jgi:hypothetical protein
MQADDKLLRAQESAVHTMHRGGSWVTAFQDYIFWENGEHRTLIWCLERHKAKAAAFADFVAHNTST